MPETSLKVCAPHDEGLIKELPLAEADEIEKTLRTASALFHNRSQWLPKHQRIDILENAAHLLSNQVHDFTKVAAEEGGKPFADSKVEVLRAIQGIKMAVSHLHHMAGEEIPMGLTPSSDHRLAFTQREPIGVALSISAFNHPLNLIIHQTVPMIATGCPVIVKPALTTPLSCLKFVDLLKEAGLPEGWCQAVVCSDELASQLVSDKRVAYLSFIGSARVGWMLRSQVSSGTRCALEHGGVAPVIVEPDADLKDAVPLIGKGGFYHAGQVCVSVQRVFAHENIADALSAQLKDYATHLNVGDPLNESTEVGPLILPREVARVDEWVQEAKKGGGQVLCGGAPQSQTYYHPTVILNPPSDCRLSQQEVFGPVVCVHPYTQCQEAIEQANSLPYAFQASVFSKNIDTVFHAAQQLNATAVMANDHTAFRVDWMPFGGRDDSGLGLGGIPYTMHETTRDKLIVIKSTAI